MQKTASCECTGSKACEVLSSWNCMCRFWTWSFDPSLTSKSKPGSSFPEAEVPAALWISSLSAHSRTASDLVLLRHYFAPCRFQSMIDISLHLYTHTHKICVCINIYIYIYTYTYTLGQSARALTFEDTCMPPQLTRRRTLVRNGAISGLTTPCATSTTPRHSK